MIRIEGLCVSLGDAKGTVRIIDESTKTAIKNSAPIILVTKLLDRSLLIHLNKNVVGVIAESGNIGSHGAGILRQLKIPCLVRIRNITNLLKEGDLIELHGSSGYILCERIAKNCHLPNTERPLGLRYESVSKHPFGITDIRIHDDWVSPRPTRCYQKLRFDMFKDVHKTGPMLLYGLPPMCVIQNPAGIMIEKGAPYVDDICSFFLANPDWFMEKTIERERDISSIKNSMKDLLKRVKSNEFDTLVYVFESGVKLYQILFKYFYMSQAISEDFLEIYLDFIGAMIGERADTDVLNLESDYVRNCLESKIDPGVSQIWKREACNPHIWGGDLIYREIPVDIEIQNAIQNKGSNGRRYQKDYKAFRKLVPLIYQMSEEYFYISSSIHSFINWCLVNMEQWLKKLYPTITVENIYQMPLEKLRAIIAEVQNL